MSRHRRRSRLKVAAVLGGTAFAALLALVVAVVIGYSILSAASVPPVQASGQCVTSPGILPTKVPQPLNSIFTEAANHYKIDPEVLAAAYVMENNPADEGIVFREPPPPYGKGSPWSTSPASASGPFQFIPGTWAAYSNSNPAHPVGDILDLVDAAYAAAKYLANLGATRGAPVGDPDNPKKGTQVWALGSYNAGGPSNFDNSETQRYMHKGVEVILALRAGGDGEEVEATCTPASPVSDVGCRDLVGNRRIVLSENAKNDLLNGFIVDGKKKAVDRRICTVLAEMAARWDIAVTVLKTGHNQFVSGTNRVSNHWVGRGADIGSVDGLVTPVNQAAKQASTFILAMPRDKAPTEVGQPWFSDANGAFTDGDHQDHIHIGYHS